MTAPTTARLLTAPSRGGIAVIALHGPAAGTVLSQIFLAQPSRTAAATATPPSSECPPTDATTQGKLSLGWIVQGDRRIDEAIVTAIADDFFEINIHGGPQVARAVLTLLKDFGCQIDSPQLGDSAMGLTHPHFNNSEIAREMIDTLPTARTALAVSAITNQWSGGLSALLAHEPDAQDLQAALARWPMMRRLLEPSEVVIAGAVNAGKSSLANALAGRQVSIVSPTAGTTRDWVRELVDLDGLPVWLTDTAGLLEQVTGDIDRQSILRAWQRVRQADVVIVLVAEAGPAEERLITGLLALPHALPVSSKVDIVAARYELAVSVESLAGLKELRLALWRRLGMQGFSPAHAMPFTQRQVESLERMLASR